MQRSGHDARHFDFYPRPPRGGRPSCYKTAASLALFLSTPSARRATIINGFQMAQVQLFLSTPSARRATRQLAGNNQAGLISIHALREEGDFTASSLSPVSAISIHALREEGDLLGLFLKLPIIRFLSTPSARRATSCTMAKQSEWRYFYPRPPRGGRRRYFPAWPCRCHFYPRPPRGGRRQAQVAECRLSDFYPRPPRGGRPALTASRSRTGNFYPRPPRGGRLISALLIYSSLVFLSTPSARRATRWSLS